MATRVVPVLLPASEVRHATHSPPVAAVMIAPTRRLRGAWPALLALLLLVAPAAAPGLVRAADDVEQVRIVFFYGDGCPHCASEEEFLAGLLQRHQRVVVEAHEVWYDAAGLRLYQQYALDYGIEPRAVPATFIGEHVWIGFSQTIGRQIEAVVEQELERLAPTPAPQPTTVAPTPSPAPTPPAETSIDIPFVGPLDLAGQSLFVTTGLIALVDGFNPCSLWVLSVLLAMMLHAGSRRRLALVGLTFLLVTAAAYGAFMVGLFSIIGLLGYLWWVQLLIAAIVLVFGLLAIKDYFWFGRGISLSIPDRHKPAIYERSRSLLAPERSLLGVIGATVVLAAGVAFIELPCTAGLPVLWSGIVAERSVAALEYGLLLGVYLGIYLIDELLLFGTVLVTMRASRMQERHGRVLKLLAGSVMLALALAMLLAPAALNSVAGTLIVFGTALVVAGVIVIAHRQLLPGLRVRWAARFAAAARPDR
jgi:cytochrome c biogenesis protein CcdA/glutaredoxin